MSEYYFFDDKWPDRSLPTTILRDGREYQHHTNVVESSNPNHTSLWYALAHCGLGILVYSDAEPAMDTPLDVLQFYIPTPIAGSDITLEDIVAFRQHLFAKYQPVLGIDYSVDLPQPDLDKIVAQEAVAVGLIPLPVN